MIHKKLISVLTISTIAIGILAGCASNKPEKDNSQSGENVVNIYSARHYDVDKNLYKNFEEKTGIKVNVVEGKSDELIERMVREGENTSADILLTVGAENISTLKEKDLIQNFDSKIIDENIDDAYKGDGWVGLTSRARIIAYNKDKVNPQNIKTYSDLLKSEFKNKVLVRSSSSSYNVAMLSSFIQEKGEDFATTWTKGLVDNFAKKPEGNDRDQVKAIAAGVGDVAIINSYYLAKMVNSSDKAEVDAAKNVGLIFPKDTHLNLSFAAVAKNSKNKKNAIELLDYLTGEEAQNAYTKENGEFPLNKKVEMPELLKSWGTFDTQTIDFEKLGSFKQKATLIFDQVGWK